MKKLLYFVSFAVGAAAGAFAACNLLKSKYEKIAQAEIDSIKAVYTYRKVSAIKETKPVDEPKEETKKEFPKPDTTDYENNRYWRASRKKYEDMTKDYKNEEEKAGKEEPDDEPYVISPAEFGELDDYEKISLTYYDDSVLSDERHDDITDEADLLVGLESLEHFGEYEVDSVFVRNDKRKCDYEILRVHEDFYSE